MSLSVSKTELFGSGSISFSSLRSSFKEASSGSVSASELRRNTTLTDTDPIVPDATENASVSTANNLSISQFRNTIKYYDINQTGTDLNLNIASATWNSNLTKNIVKRVNLTGTCGSTNGTPAASLDANSYNVFLIITGSILGTGGSAGNEDTATNGGDGGHALYINTNSTGTVTVTTSGNSAQVYGGGGGGGGGGDGGDGGGGSYTQTGTNKVFKGNSGQKGGLNPPYNSMCNQACSNQWAGAFCEPGCYLTFGQSGCNCPCWSNEGAGLAECNCCYRNESYSYTVNTSGGTGGQGTPGGLGQGYLQTRTFASTPQTVGETPNGPTAGGGSGAQDGSEGGRGGDGGYWGQNGDDGEDGDDGVDGTRTNGTDPTPGTSGGTAGRAVSGSNYVIDPNGVDSAYLGLK